jgi:hypothetical protein
MMVFSIGAAALALAACGSSNKSSSSSSSPSASTSAPTTTTKAKPAAGGVASRTYSVKLAGNAEVPKGAPTGTGTAVVSIHGKTNQVCWRFNHLHGFTGPTFAHIHVGGAGTSGNIVVPLSTGASFLHAGCVTASSMLLSAIEKHPHGYYVNIHSKQYPGGAVRSQL